ncbi:hypothetical protein J6590_079353 [Homalodisca vitripennis]|nr:hypothetical protein J6590_079353 [Homalodisca vitripennis]
MVLQSPSFRVASDLLSLRRSVSSRDLGLIMGHGHLRKHLHRVDIFWEDLLCRMEHEETAKHLLFDCPAIARERYAILEGLDRLFLAVCGAAEIIDWSASWCASRVSKRPLRLNIILRPPQKRRRNPQQRLIGCKSIPL